MSKLMERLETLSQFQERELRLKMDQEALNKDIHDYMSAEFQMTGPHTIIDIVKKALETSVEPKIIT